MCVQHTSGQVCIVKSCFIAHDQTERDELNREIKKKWNVRTVLTGKVDVEVGNMEADKGLALLLQCGRGKHNVLCENFQHLSSLLLQFCQFCIVDLFKLLLIFLFDNEAYFGHLIEKPCQQNGVFDGSLFLT